MKYKRRGYASLIGILVVLIIIGFLIWKGYFNKLLPAGTIKQSLPDNKMIDNKIDTTNYKTIIDSTRERVNELNKKTEKTNKKIEELY